MAHRREFNVNFFLLIDSPLTNHVQTMNRQTPWSGVRLLASVMWGSLGLLKFSSPGWTITTLGASGRSAGSHHADSATLLWPSGPSANREVKGSRLAIQNAWEKAAKFYESGHKRLREDTNKKRSSDHLPKKKCPSPFPTQVPKKCFGISNHSTFKTRRVSTRECKCHKFLWRSA